MSPQRRWWFGLIPILLVAAALRFMGYAFGLPYFFDSDEPWFFYEAAWQRGLIPFWIHPNPTPALIGVYKLAQVSSEALTGSSALGHAAEIFTALHLVGAILSLITIVFVGLCARALADDKAGWLAAALWALMPLVVRYSASGVAEPWMMLCAAVALYCAAMTFRSERARYPMLSVWAGLLGFTFKYSMFPFAGIGLAAALWKVWAAPEQRGRWLRIAAAQIVSIAAFLGFMVLIGGLLGDVSGRAREMSVFFDKPLANYADPASVARIFGVAFWGYGIAPLIFLATYAAALAILARQQASLKNPRLAAWLLFGALGVFTALLVPSYLFIKETLPRYMFAANLIFSILTPASLSVIFDALRRQPALRKWRGVIAAAAAILVIIWLMPLGIQAASEARERLKPYTLTDMMIWASNTLGEGGVVAGDGANRVFDREWGGYTGAKRALVYDVDALAKTPQEWRQEGYRYLEMAQDHVERLMQSEGGRAYFDQLQELRRFPAPESTEGWTGLPYVVYQVYRPETSADLVFGDTFHLVGYDGLQTTVAAGTPLNLTFYWQALKPPEANYSLLLHVEPEGSEGLVAQADGAAGPAGRPTLTWVIPSETLVSEPVALMLPDDLPAGDYRLLIGVYDPYSGQRLPTAEGDRALLATLHVTSP